MPGIHLIRHVGLRLVARAVVPHGRKLHGIRSVGHREFLSLNPQEEERPDNDKADTELPSAHSCTLQSCIDLRRRTLVSHPWAPAVRCGNDACTRRSPKGALGYHD
jgi:hypothetical protein